jgi:hypothetical protein
MRLILGCCVGFMDNRVKQTARRWCERGDLNPHGLPRQILSLVRLPISPLSRGIPVFTLAGKVRTCNANVGGAVDGRMLKSG